MCSIKQRAKTPKQKAIRRQQILLATKEKFFDHTYEEVNLNHIAADVGITKAALYRYFRNKETLFLALYIESLEQLITSNKLTQTKPCLADSMCEVLIQNPIFCKLSAILHTILERNLNYEEALEFKFSLLKLMKSLCIQVKRHPEAKELSDRDIFTLLMLVQQALIGTWHMTHPSGAIADVLEKSPLTIFKRSFETELKEHVSRLFLQSRA